MTATVTLFDPTAPSDGVPQSGTVPSRLHGLAGAVVGNGLELLRERGIALGIVAHAIVEIAVDEGIFRTARRRAFCEFRSRRSSPSTTSACA